MTLVYEICDIALYFLVVFYQLIYVLFSVVS